MKISNRILALSDSATLIMAARSQELRAQGVDIISMSLGEPDFPTPDAIKAAAKQAVDDNFSHYGPVLGIPSLRQAIANSVPNRVYGPNDIIVSVGAKQALFHVIMAMVNPGDEVIIPTPSWVSYSEMVKVAEGQPVTIKTSFESGYKLTAAQLEAAITDQSKLLILCSPNNPTGSVYSREELQALVDVLVKHPNIYVIADEIYDRIRYIDNYTSLTSFPQILDRIIWINGVSKAYAMTGYRLGWMGCKDAEILTACKKLQSQDITCPTMVAQKAAEAALTLSQDCVESMRREFEHRRAVICGLLDEIPHIRYHVPEGAFYVFVDVSGTGMNGDQMCEFLLDKAHVAVVTGSAFGDSDCVRLGFAMSEEAIREALRRIREALS